LKVTESVLKRSDIRWINLFRIAND